MDGVRRKRSVDEEPAPSSKTDTVESVSNEKDKSSEEVRPPVGPDVVEEGRHKRSADVKDKSSRKTGTKQSVSDEKDKTRGRVLPPVSPELTKIVNEIFGEIDDLRHELKEVKEPQGTKENPARTCSDIYLVYPDSQDGK